MMHATTISSNTKRRAAKTADSGNTSESVKRGAQAEYYQLTTKHESVLFTYRCNLDSDEFTGLLGARCPTGFVCTPHQENPAYGFVSFDHVGWAVLTIFTVVTFESWPAVFHASLQTSGEPVVLFYIFVVLIGAYFIPNLALAVINDRYHMAIRRHWEDDGTDDWDRNEDATSDAPSSPLSRKASSKVPPRLRSVAALKSGHHNPMARNVGSTAILRSETSNSLNSTAVLSNDSMARIQRGRGNVTIVDPTPQRPAPPGCWLRFRNVLHRMTQGYSLPDYDEQLLAHFGGSGPATTALRSSTSASPTTASGALKTASSSDAATSRRQRMTVFTAFIIFCILANTAVLAAQHHNQPDWLDNVTEISNQVFLLIFAVELLIVLTAVGFLRFFTSGFYLLDIFVVSLSIVELFAAGTSFITVFRALRLLRVLKLVRNAPSLQAVVRVIISALKETLYLNLVLFLLILVFALAGMQFFGTALQTANDGNDTFNPSQRPTDIRASFENFLTAFYTVFQIITTDNWTEVMWAAMRTTHPASALYFVALVLIGYYVVINLFLAILIQGFEREANRAHAEALLRGGLDLFDDDSSEALRREELAHVQEHIVNSMSSPTSIGPATNSQDDEQVTVLFASAREEKDLAAAAERAKLNPVIDALFRSFGEVPETALSLALVAQREGLREMIQALPLSGKTCSRCKCPKQKVLSSPPFMPRGTVDELHDKHCYLAELRHDKEEYLVHVLAVIHEHMTENAMLTEEMSFALLTNTQKMGMFRTLRTSNLRSWSDIRDEVRDELAVLRLAVGEEQIGRAHVSYVYTGLKLKQATNGSTSLFIFGPENAFRAWLTSVTLHPVFDALVLTLIAASTVLVIADNPRTEYDPQTREVMDYLDLSFTAAFALEIVMRILATGLILHPGAYLRSGWNWVDLTSVVISFVSSFSAVRSLRVLRFLRPLRTIKRYRGLRIVVATILSSIKSITHVVALSSMCYVLFGILAVQLFAGKLYECNDSTVRLQAECIGTYVATATVPDPTTNTLVNVNYEIERRWERYERNFDHIGYSMLTLFQVSTGDDWADVMFNAIDAKSTTEAPVRGYQPVVGLFFVLFFLVSNFFFVNVFVGVVIVNFSIAKQKVDGLAFLTEEQRAWVDAQRAILNMRPEPLLILPTSAAWRRRLDQVVRSPQFEIFIAFCIALNVAIIAMEYEGQPKDYGMYLNYCGWGFAVLFFLEMLLKLTAHGLRYFYLPWNRFDFFLAWLGVVSFAFEYLDSSAHGRYVPINFSVLRVLRFVRVLRVLRLFKQARKVRVLVETLWHSLPSIVNIALLLLVLYVMFGVIGVQLFALARPGGRFLDEQYFNFYSFPMALQLLFVFTTNEKWSDAMYDLMSDPPYCSEAANDCGYWYAPAFFVPFVVIASFVVANLFLAIILDNFSTTMKLDQSSVTLADLHRFLEVWAQFDPDGKRTIPTRALPKLLAALQPPLGTTRAHSRIELLKRMTEDRILDHDGVVHFAEVLVPLARHAMANGGALLGYDLASDGFPELKSLPTVWYAHRPAHVGHTMAATYVAACYRRHRQREKFLNDRSAKKKLPQHSKPSRRASLFVEDF
jgi:hypothetical protein